MLSSTSGIVGLTHPILYWNSKSGRHESGCAMNVAMHAFPNLLEKRKTSSFVPPDHVELRDFF